MTARRAFKSYRFMVLRPILARIQVHLLESLALIVAEYMGLSLTREDHFRRIIGSSLVSYSHPIVDPVTFDTPNNFVICITPTNFSGVDIILGYTNRESGLWYMKRITDPPVQSLAGSLKMFDIPIAMLARISVAASWASKCSCTRPCGGKCIRVCIALSGKEIIDGLHAAYKNQAKNIIHEYVTSASESDTPDQPLS